MVALSHGTSVKTISFDSIRYLWLGLGLGLGLGLELGLELGFGLELGLGLGLGLGVYGPVPKLFHELFTYVHCTKSYLSGK